MFRLIETFVGIVGFCRREGIYDLFMHGSVNVQRKIAIVAVILLVTAMFFLLSAAISTAQSEKLTVSFLDVGQGDAIFIESPTGVQVLIDGGPDRGVLRELSKQMKWYDREIDLIIATHPDSDHISGLIDVLARYDVRAVIQSSVNGDTPVYTALVEAIHKEETKEYTALRGQRFDIGGGSYLEILFPDRDVPYIETNTGSVIAKLVYGETSFLFTGDSPKTIEEYLAALDGESLDVDVLKAGHHGSKTSSSPIFVGYASPEYAVLSYGCGNRYGHPHKEVMEILERFEIKILDTCKEGTVTFVSDGKTVAQ